MKIYSIKPLFQKTLKPLADFFIKIKLHPTAINFLALFVSITAGILILFIDMFSYFLFIIPLLLFIRIAFNALDGMVARGLKVSSVNGEILNEFIDRLSDCAIFICLNIYLIKVISRSNRAIFFTADHKFLLCALFIILFLLNSYLGILGKAAGKSRIYNGFIGKADRMFYLGLACLVYFFVHMSLIWTIFLVFVVAGTIISIGQRLWTALK